MLLFFSRVAACTCYVICPAVLMQIFRNHWFIRDSLQGQHLVAG